MNRKLSLLAFFILFALAMFTFYFKVSIFENTNKNNVNVRSRPSIQSVIIGKIQPGEFVIGIKAKENWSLVFVNSSFGYAYSRVLSKKVIRYNNVEIRQNILVSGILIIFSLLFLDLNGKKDTKSKKKAQLPPKESVENHDNLSSKVKGDQFEGFIANKLAENRFISLKKWRSDKFIEETKVYPEDSKYPDIEAEFKPDNKIFAVECKWRKSFFNGGIQIGEPYKLNNYKKYQMTNNYPVFIAIGIGGLPSKPNRLFVVPLYVFESNSISMYKLQIYEKKPVEGRFFFNSETENLT